jgi:hypothetical protein
MRVAPTRRRAACVASWLLLALTLAGCDPGSLPGSAERAGQHAAGSAINSFVRIWAPGLGVACAGRRGEHGFTESAAKQCLSRWSSDYARGVRNGIAAH